MRSTDPDDVVGMRDVIRRRRTASDGGTRGWSDVIQLFAVRRQQLHRWNRFWNVRRRRPADLLSDACSVRRKYDAGKRLLRTLRSSHGRTSSTSRYSFRSRDVDGRNVRKWLFWSGSVAKQRILLRWTDARRDWSQRKRHHVSLFSDAEPLRPALWAWDLRDRRCDVMFGVVFTTITRSIRSCFPLNFL